MIEQLNNSVKFLAFYSASKAAKTGLTVTVDVYNPAGTHIVTAGSVTELANGVYFYTLASGSVTTTGEYVAVFHTTDATVDQQDIPSLWVVNRAGISHLDADVSSRSTYAGADTAGTTTLLARLTSTRAGLLDNLDAAISSRLAASSYTAPDNADIATLIARLTATRAGLLDNLSNLDAAISSRLATIGYTAPPSAASVRSEMDANSTKLANLDAAVSTRSTYAGADTAGTGTLLTRLTSTRAGNLDNLDVAVSTRNATAPDNASITAIKSKTDNLPAQPAAVGSPMTLTVAYDSAKTAAQAATALSNVQWTDARAVKLDNLDAAVSSIGGGTAPTATQIADAVWDESLSSHLTAGSTGEKLNAAGNAGDPWTAELPGTYTGDQAGAIVAKLNIGEPTEPVIVIPAPPTDAAVCRVYGYFETVDNKPAADVEISFQLICPTLAKSDKLLGNRAVTVNTNSDGRIVDANANFYVELNRNDSITPAGSKYNVFIREKFVACITLTTDLFDLASIIQ